MDAMMFPTQAPLHTEKTKEEKLQRQKSYSSI